MSTRVLRIVLIGSLSLHSARAGSDPTELAAARRDFEAQLASIEATRVEQRAKALADYPASLEALNTKVTELGDLQKVLAVQAEIERFKTTPEIPDEAIVRAPRELRTLQLNLRRSLTSSENKAKTESARVASKHRSRLEQLVKTLTQAKRIPDAVAVNDELARIRNLPALASASIPAEAPRADEKEPVPAMPSAVDSGLDWLARHQDDEGHWSSHDFHERCSGAKCTNAGELVHDIGCTGLSLLAFLRAGNTPSTGRYRSNVKRGLEYLIGAQDEKTGCFGIPNSHMAFIYDHAIATLCVIEGYGATGSTEFARPAQAGLDFIKAARNPKSAWRYAYPPTGENDLSVTAWMVSCLTAGKQHGLGVDDAAFEGAKRLIDDLTDENSWRTGYITKGGLSAREPRSAEKWPPERTEAMTAVAVRSRLSLGEPSGSPAIRGGTARLLKQLPRWNENEGTIDFYYWFHGTEALRQVGGSAWGSWRAKLFSAIVEQQRSDGCERGSWDPQFDPWGVRGGRVYSTAMLTLCLEVRDR